MPGRGIIDDVTLYDNVGGNTVIRTRVDAGGTSGTEYTEDAAAASDPIGGAQILVRKDTPAAITDTDGDNIARRGTNFGAAFSQILDSSGNFIDSFGGGTQYTEGDTDASITGTAVMWEDTADTLRSVSAAKPLPVSDANVSQESGGNLDTIAGDTTSIDGKITACNTGAIAGTVTANAGTNLNTSALALESGGNLDTIAGDTTSIDGKITACNTGAIAGTVTANAGTNLNTSALALESGGNLDTISGDTTSIDGKITACNTGAVTISAALPAGSNNIGDVDVLTLPGVAGDVAHDSADSGNPLKWGAKSIAHGANPSAVAANDRTDIYANRHGIPWVIGGHPNVLTLRANYTTAQSDTAIASVGGGNKIVVTRLSVTVDNACSVDVQCRIGFAAATTPTTTGVVLSHPGIAAGSGVVEGNGSGILGIGADGEDLRITSEVPTGGSIDVVVSYYTIES
jgi:hypothetical protein